MGITKEDMLARDEARADTIEDEWYGVTENVEEELHSSQAYKSKINQNKNDEQNKERAEN